MSIGWMLIPIAVSAAWLVPLVPRYVSSRATSMWMMWVGSSAVTAAVLAISADRLDADVWSWLGFGAAVVPLGALLVVDVLTHRLPRQISLVSAAVVLGFLLIGDGPSGRGAVVVAAIANCLISVVFRVLTRGSLGMGDVMVAPLLGAIVGWFSPWAMVALWLVASVLGAVWSLVVMASGRRSRRDHIAYGPFLIVGTLVAVLGSAF
ncbi:MAG: prepilin peptidase [Actinobacteria bacterium]|nr:prepilin peptidase [Actinomycetota bacterium]